MTSQPGWDALLITTAFAWISALIGFFLYRYSESTVKQKGIRFSGASAIAVVMFILSTKFFLSVHAELHPVPKIDPQYANELLQNLNTCIEQEGAFPCKKQAIEMRDMYLKLLQQP